MELDGTKLRLRWETRKHVWIIYTTRWFWFPDFRFEADYSHVCWGFVGVERISKEWLEFCEQHGGGLRTTLEWLVDDLTDSSITEHKTCNKQPSPATSARKR